MIGDVTRFLKRRISNFVSLLHFENLVLKTDIVMEQATVSQKRKLDSDGECTSKKRITCHSQRPGTGEERYNETEYFFQNGLRKVYPYDFTYTSFCKLRWVGQNILNIFSDEFRLCPREWHQQNMEAGRLTVNGEHVSDGLILKENDLIASNIHRHEIPVLAAPIKIVHESDTLVIVDKPPSIPVHPCGRFRSNSVAFILGKENGLKNLHTVHRLDRVTSGILMFTKNIDVRRKLNEEIVNRKVKKQYVCRVEGEFPEGDIVCSEPLEKLSPKLSLYHVCSDGKPSETNFKKLSFNGKSSVVLCSPLTGRTHQIRVHLQYLGFPILNDILYNTDDFGPLKGKGGDFGKSKDDLVKEIMKSHNQLQWFAATPENSSKEIKESPIRSAIVSCLQSYSNVPETKVLEEKYHYDPNKVVIQDSCLMCREEMCDPCPEDMMIFLHALHYQGDDWEFKTEMPIWAKEEWKEC